MDGKNRSTKVLDAKQSYEMFAPVAVAQTRTPFRSGRRSQVFFLAGTLLSEGRRREKAIERNSMVTRMRVWTPLER